MVDVDGSGEIDQGELRGLAQMLGMELSNADLVGQSLNRAPTRTLSFSRLRVRWAACVPLFLLWCGWLQETAMEEMDADGSGEVDFEEFSEWWTKQQAAGGKWQLDQISAMAKTKRWADRLGDGLLSMLAHHYRFVLPAGSGAKVRPNPPAAVLCQPR